MPDDEKPTAPDEKSATHPKKSKRPAKRRKARGNRNGKQVSKANVAFPKHSISKCLRIPQAVLEQNAGKDCTYREAAQFAGLGYTGQIGVEISSALKYGLLERTTTGRVQPSDLIRRIARPQKPNDRRDAMREGVAKAPGISDAYKHYRGENLPDLTFLKNAARDTLHVPEDKVDDFVTVFIDDLKDAELIEEVSGKQRVLDITHTGDADIKLPSADEHLKKVGKGVTVQSTDTCFVMMPFADPLGSYYAGVYEPAIKRAGLTAVRADTDIFGTGKIIDQIWDGIRSARVLVAELTKRNPNVLYELGLAHALKKPVVLVSSNEEDVPFDVRHVRVIYYDVADPFWGNKLIDKVAENILSALKNPTEAILFGD